MTDLVERLRSAHENSQQRIVGSDIFKEAADEIDRLRAALRCERESGMCIAVHDPERDPCTKDNCQYMRDADEQSAERTDG